MTISASGSARSKTESGPSLSEVTTNSWPPSSRNGRRPSSPETLPSNSPGSKSTRVGVGVVWPSWYRSILGIASRAYDFGNPSTGSSYRTQRTFDTSASPSPLSPRNGRRILAQTQAQPACSQALDERSYLASNSRAEQAGQKNANVGSSSSGSSVR